MPRHAGRNFFALHDVPFASVTTPFLRVLGAVMSPPDAPTPGVPFDGMPPLALPAAHASEAVPDEASTAATGLELPLSPPSEAVPAEEQAEAPQQVFMSTDGHQNETDCNDVSDTKCPIAAARQSWDSYRPKVDRWKQCSSIKSENLANHVIIRGLQKNPVLKAKAALLCGADLVKRTGWGYLLRCTGERCRIH